MKFLHLSDLHIGKNVNGFSMLDEQRHAFDQIIRFIETENPSAVIIAGDVYDRAVPGIEAVRVFDDFLTALAVRQTAVMLIPGNHDSPERLAYASRLLSEKKLFFCCSYNDKSRHKVTLTDEYGDVNFWLLPFMRPVTVRGLFGEREIETYDEAFAALLESAQIDDTARNILVAHQFFVSPGALPMRSESEINPVGGLDAITAGLLSRFDYAALGHLHRPQRVGGDNIRYAGSPVKYSFSECRHDKSVTMVELYEKGRWTITALPLCPLHDMREIKGTLEHLTSESFVSMYNPEDYLSVVLTDEDEVVDPMGKLRSVYPNIMALDFENSRTSIDISSVSANPESLETLSAYDLFCEFFLETSGSVMSGGQARLIRELLDSEAIL